MTKPTLNPHALTLWLKNIIKTFIYKELYFHSITLWFKNLPMIYKVSPFHSLTLWFKNLPLIFTVFIHQALAHDLNLFCKSLTWSLLLHFHWYILLDSHPRILTKFFLLQAVYQFSWEVNDPDNRNIYGQTESRDGDKTEGRYEVVLPDTRKKIVTYT